MIHAPFIAEPLLRAGPLIVTAPVVVTWAIMAAMAGASLLLTRKLSVMPSRVQTALELLVGTLDTEIRATMQTDPALYRSLIGTLFLFVLIANWSSLIPGLNRRPRIWKPTPRSRCSCLPRRSCPACARVAFAATLPPSPNRRG